MMMPTQTTLAIIAIVATIGIIGVLIAETFVIPLLQQAAEARGCGTIPRNISAIGIAFNASKGRCFHS
jgi:hypothetical protein